MNTRQEFLEEVADRNLVCARVGFDDENYGRTPKWFVLREGYTAQEFNQFLDYLDFDYDEGYGSQELFGVILFEDSYSDRFEYDGSEAWDNHKMPSAAEVMETSQEKVEEN